MLKILDFNIAKSHIVIEWSAWNISLNNADVKTEYYYLSIILHFVHNIRLRFEKTFLKLINRSQGKYKRN